MSQNQDLKLRDVSERDKELYSMSSIESKLPIKFATTKREWVKFEGRCNACKCTIPGESFRGRIDQTFPSVALLDAVGLCHQCQILTPFSYRLHDDLTITSLRDGRWLRFDLKKPKPSFGQKVFLALGFPVFLIVVACYKLFKIFKSKP